MRRSRLTSITLVTISLGAIMFVVASVDWRFWQRYATKPSGASDLTVDWYQPQEIVAGASNTTSILPAKIDNDRFQEAFLIAEKYKSDALIVAVDGEIIAERYWNGTTRQTPLLTFSFHKTISALLVGLAIEDGYIASADVKLGTLIPEWSDDPRGEVILRDAMRMSGGFSHPNFDGGPFSSAARFNFGSNTEAETLKATLRQGNAKEFDYGDRPAEVVGVALQKALPVSYGRYLSKRLWAPIGASDAAVTLGHPGGMAITYCCLMASARDWLRIGMLLEGNGLIRGQQIIPSQWLEQMTTPSPTNANFGLFIWLGNPYVPERSYTPSVPAVVRSSAPFAVDDVIFLDGAGGQRVYASPSLNLVVVRIGEYRPDWDETELFNSIVQKLTDLPSSPLSGTPDQQQKKENPS